jgi:endonuclease YncB( thermonuclease family)
MKNIFIAIFVLLFALIAEAQNVEQKNEGEFGCRLDGDSGHISFVGRGKIVKVIDNDTVVFITDIGKKKYVSLIAVDSKGNKSKAKTFLKNNVLGREADLIFSSSQMRKRKISGILEVDGKDINRLMLEKGIAEYEESDSYQISYYSDCVYYKVFEKAKEEKLGIWAK